MDEVAGTSEPHVPVVVQIGVLTPSEYTTLSRVDQQTVEKETVRLLTTYGLDWLAREKARLRGELTFLYGV